MSTNEGNKPEQPEDRTLLDPLDADELKALREARERLQATKKKASSKPADVGGDDDDDGIAATRAMRAIPSFDSPSPTKTDESPPPKSSFMAEPKPMAPGSATVRTGDHKADGDAATLIAQSDQLATVMSSSGDAKASPPPSSDKRVKSQPPAFGENTLMWMEPVKEVKVARAERNAQPRGASRARAPGDTAGRRAMAGVVAVLGVLVMIAAAVVLLQPKGHPATVEIVTDPGKATVVINGKPTDILTPMKASLPPGTHDVEIRLKGHRTEKMSLHIVSGAKPTRRSLLLHPLSRPGLKTVTLNVDPVAANIALDGKVYPARKALKIANVDPKTKHLIEIDVGGYKAIKQEIEPNKLEPVYRFTLEREATPAAPDTPAAPEGQPAGAK